MLTKEKCFEVDPIKTEQQSEIFLEYYLTEHLYNDDENHEVKTYGIEVLKKEMDNSSVKGVEQRSVEHLSTDKKKVYEILRKLYENTVTPVSVLDVLDSLIGVAY